MSNLQQHTSQPVICQKVSKSYKLFHRNRDRLIDFCSLGFVKRHTLFYALKNVSFEVGKGECIGIIGENGSGKSTLLKVITGTTFSDDGVVETTGRISALLELGTGFHPELTGRQNVQLNAQFYGFFPEQLRTIEEKVKVFSELGEFFDQPIKTYSSGMHVRLGFALACHVNPDIVIIDEALAVGDAYFQQKCIRKIKEFIDVGVTCLFVSHDPSLIRLLCSRAILLHQGRKIEEGLPRTILNIYNGLISQHNQKPSYKIISEQEGEVQHGNKKVVIESVQLLNAKGFERRYFSYNEKIQVLVTCQARQKVSRCCVGVLITDVYGLEVFGTNTLQKNYTIESLAEGTQVQVSFNIGLSCGPGRYFISTAAHLGETHIDETYDWKDNILQFNILSAKECKFTGRSFLEHSIEIIRS